MSFVSASKTTYAWGPTFVAFLLLLFGSLLGITALGLLPAMATPVTIVQKVLLWGGSFGAFALGFMVLYWATSKQEAAYRILSVLFAGISLTTFLVSTLLPQG